MICTGSLAWLFSRTKRQLRPVQHICCSRQDETLRFIIMSLTRLSASLLMFRKQNAWFFRSTWNPVSLALERLTNRHQTADWSHNAHRRSSTCQKTFLFSHIHQCLDFFQKNLPPILQTYGEFDPGLWSISDQLEALDGPNVPDFTNISASQLSRGLTRMINSYLLVHQADTYLLPRELNNISLRDLQDKYLTKDWSLV